MGQNKTFNLKKMSQKISNNRIFNLEKLKELGSEYMRNNLRILNVISEEMFQMPFGEIAPSEKKQIYDMIKSNRIK